MFKALFITLKMKSVNKQKVIWMPDTIRKNVVT